MLHQTIYKYELDLKSRQEIMIPKYSKILSAQNQNGKVCVWAVVNTSRDYELMPVSFYMTETGGNAETTAYKKFLDTVQLNSGAYVVHVFYEVPWYE